MLCALWVAEGEKRVKTRTLEKSQGMRNPDLASALDLCPTRRRAQSGIGQPHPAPRPAQPMARPEPAATRAAL